MLSFTMLWVMLCLTFPWLEAWHAKPYHEGALYKPLEFCLWLQTYIPVGDSGTQEVAHGTQVHKECTMVHWMVQVHITRSRVHWSGSSVLQTSRAYIQAA